MTVVITAVMTAECDGKDFLHDGVPAVKDSVGRQSLFRPSETLSAERVAFGEPVPAVSSGCVVAVGVDWLGAAAAARATVSPDRSPFFCVVLVDCCCVMVNEKNEKVNFK